MQETTLLVAFDFFAVLDNGETRYYKTSKAAGAGLNEFFKRYSVQKGDIISVPFTTCGGKSRNIDLTVFTRHFKIISDKEFIILTCGHPVDHMDEKNVNNLVRLTKEDIRENSIIGWPMLAG